MQTHHLNIDNHDGTVIISHLSPGPVHGKSSKYHRYHAVLHCTHFPNLREAAWNILVLG